jgi:hypothetical protein
MVRAIEKIRDVPGESNRYALTRQFQIMVLYALSYAPDRESTGAFSQLRKEFEEYFGESARIEFALERDFFQNLYVDRHERQEVRDLISALRPVLVHGHIGVGKTVVLKKIQLDSLTSGVFRLIYFDLKADVDLFDDLTPANFNKRFRNYVYGRVYEEFIANSSTYLEEWPIYEMRFDPGYAAFREWVLGIVQRPLRTDNEWREAVEKDIIKARWLSLSASAEARLETLLGFLKERITYALCFDNIDRHPEIVQRQMLSKSVDISNRLQIPVIVAIREPNLRRLWAEGAKGDVILSDYFERLATGEDKSVAIENLEDASVEKLLVQRLEFVHVNDEFNSLGDLFGHLQDEFEFDFEEFKRRVRNVLRELTKTFIEEDAYTYCNQNLREIQVFLFRLITNLLLNPAEEYSIAKLLPQQGTSRITRLRTYFYKWLICGDAPIPRAGVRPFGIYDDFETSLSMLNLRILEFVYNWERQNPEHRLDFGEMSRVFRRFGVTQGLLKERLERLTKFQDFFELRVIWLDRYEHTPIKETTKVEMMPMGNYLIKTLTTSREYAFWNALTADLAEDIVGSGFTFADTITDEFKFKVVYNLIQRILLPALKKEISHFDQNLITPRNWRRSNLDYFKRYFSIGGRFYPDRLLNSVMNSIPFSELPKDAQKKEQKRFMKLLREIERVEGYRPPS